MDSVDSIARRAVITEMSANMKREHIATKKKKIKSEYELVSLPVQQRLSVSCSYMEYSACEYHIFFKAVSIEQCIFIKHGIK